LTNRGIDENWKNEENEEKELHGRLYGTMKKLKIVTVIYCSKFKKSIKNKTLKIVDTSRGSLFPTAI
jgi:hypothetical protein